MPDEPEEHSTTSENEDNMNQPPAESARPGRRARPKRDFPPSSFEDALIVPLAVFNVSGGVSQKVRRLRVFEHLGRSPDSGPGRQIVSNAVSYGLLEGASRAEHVQLTVKGLQAINPEEVPSVQFKARFDLAVIGIGSFKSLYQRYKDGKLPSREVMRDTLTDEGVDSEVAAECVDYFLENVKYLGLLKTVAGAERLLSAEHVLEDLPPHTPAPRQESKGTVDMGPDSVPDVSSANATEGTDGDWEKTCFYITPIGEPNSEPRKHSDLFLSSLVEPAITELGLKVVRADQIGKPGMITAQIIEHVVKSRLVVADLSFHNPNVFYELSLRHACGLPTVQLIRRCDRIPFDLDQFRTIQIDTTDIYTLVPHLETHKAEIASQARRALSDPRGTGNPLTVFYPGLRVLFSDRE